MQLAGGWHHNVERWRVIAAQSPALSGRRSLENGQENVTLKSASKHRAREDIRVCHNFKCSRICSKAWNGPRYKTLGRFREANFPPGLGVAIKSNLRFLKVAVRFRRPSSSICRFTSTHQPDTFIFPFPCWRSTGQTLRLPKAPFTETLF